jgi:putative redox protein
MKTRTVWKKDHQFTSYQDHNAIQIDGSRQHGNGPKSLLLSGLAGCSGIDVVDILKKMKVKFSELEIDVETTQTEENPKVFNDIHMIYKINVGEENLEKVKKAIELSLGKYCGVSAMLRKNSEINYSVQLI